MAYVHPQTVWKVSKALGSKDAKRPATGRSDAQKAAASHEAVVSNAAAAARRAAASRQGGHGTPGGAPGDRTTPTTPAKPADPAQPFLTATQQGALGAYDNSYSYNIGKVERTIGDATVDTNKGLSDSYQKMVADTSGANQSMAARGLFQSSIRDADLNDISATQAMRDDLLRSNLSRLMTDQGGIRERLNTDYGTTHNMYNQFAVANAAAITPNIAKPPATTSSTGAPGSAGGAASTGGLPNPRANSTTGLEQNTTGIYDPLRHAGNNPPTATTPLEGNTTGLYDPLAHGAPSNRGATGSRPNPTSPTAALNG